MKVFIFCYVVLLYGQGKKNNLIQLVLFYIYIYLEKKRNKIFVFILKLIVFGYVIESVDDIKLVSESLV